MAKSELDVQIRTRIDRFVEEVSTLLRAAAVESVREALGGGGAAAPWRGRKLGRPTPPRAARKAGKRTRRSAGDIENQAAQILAFVKAHPGCSMGDLTAQFKRTAVELRRPVQELLAAKALRTQGHRRGTTYYPGGGGGKESTKTGAQRKAAPRKGGSKKRTKAKRRVSTKRSTSATRRSASNAAGTAAA